MSRISSGSFQNMHGAVIVTDWPRPPVFETLIPSEFVDPTAAVQ